MTLVHWHFELIEITGQGNGETYLTGKPKANINSTLLTNLL